MTAVAELLKAKLNGQLITPEDADYDEAREVFYGGIDPTRR